MLLIGHVLISLSTYMCILYVYMFRRRRWHPSFSLRGGGGIPISLQKVEVVFTSQPKKMEASPLLFRCRWHPHLTPDNGDSIPTSLQNVETSLYMVEVASPVLFRSWRCHPHPNLRRWRRHPHSLGGGGGIHISLQKVETACPVLFRGKGILGWQSTIWHPHPTLEDGSVIHTSLHKVEAQFCVV